MATSLNGATWRMDSMVCSSSCDSSRLSMMPEYDTRIGRPRGHFANSNSVMAHFRLISPSFSSMPACFSAASQISSMPSLC